MGGIVSQSVYSLEDVQRIAGSSWCQEYYTKFMSVAVLQPVVTGDGTVLQQYRVGADFVNREIAIHLAEQDLKTWTKKNALETHNYMGHSMCLFSPEEISSCTDTLCECKDAETIRMEFCRSPVAQQLQDYLSSLPMYPNSGEVMDPGVYLFAVDPVERCNEICKDNGSLFFDVDYAAGPHLAGPFAGTHGSKPPYNFASLRCFLRLGHVNPPPTCMFDTSTACSVIESIVQVDTMCGNSAVLAALGAIAGLYNGEYIKTLINPSTELNPYGVYSLKVQLMCENPAKGGVREMVTAYVLVDDFLPCDESGCLMFASSHKHHTQSAWASLFEKAATKMFGQNSGGYRETAHSPEYAGRFMELLTGVTCKEYDVTKQKDWVKLRKLLVNGQDCRIGAATVTKKDLRKSKAVGIVTGVGVHGYTLLKTMELKTKYKKPHKILRLRNTWGRYEWQGKWSDDSAEFKEHHKALETPGGDDGSFWISAEDFAELFQGIYAIIIPKDWSSHTARTAFLHTKAELRVSHSFMDIGATAEESVTESSVSVSGSHSPLHLANLVEELNRHRVVSKCAAYDDTILSPDISTECDQHGLESIMNSEKPRSTKGPGCSIIVAIPTQPASSVKMSTKLSAKISVKMSTKLSTKSSMESDDEHDTADIDAAALYGAEGRRLPRQRRNTFIF